MNSLKKLHYITIRYIQINMYHILLILITVVISISVQQELTNEINVQKHMPTISEIGESGLKNSDNIVVENQPLFPEDLFTLEQRRSGAIILHIIGVIYMFIALAIVCDDFFVPALDVIIEKFEIQDDVAGATFMAAGGSAPELFTSVIGVFVSFDDVGIGTIVGSAVFNILFVIAMCTMFSKSVLTLTWWPLFRDCTFYSTSLLTLIIFFRDNFIYWYEALILFLIYVGYVSFMKWNHTVEKYVKSHFVRTRITKVSSTDHLVNSNNILPRTSEISCTNNAASTSTSSAPNSTTNQKVPHHGKFRHGLLQLMIHTIDPLHDGRVDEKATQLHAMASLKVLLDATKPQNGTTTTAKMMATTKIPTTNLKKDSTATTTIMTDVPNGTIINTIPPDNLEDLEESVAEPVDISWPDTNKKRLTYLILAPIVFPLWLTLPDTKTPNGKRFFVFTFIGSIIWIAIYSYLMVWWANVIGETVSIPPEVMGLTFLAAGTSIPDLITSVIVARKGFGDMAVSSSVGSNIFDVTVGLPVPWLLYGIIYGKPVEVNSVGMVCSITILFMMLLFVIISIACFRWKMNKGLGVTMLILYFVFVAVSLMFEYEMLTCPV